VSTIGVWADDPASEIALAIAEAPWAAAAGVRVVASADSEAVDGTIVVATHPATIERLNNRGAGLPSGAVLVVGPALGALTPRHSMRLRARPLGEPDDVVISDHVQMIDERWASGDVVITANVGFVDHPIGVIHGAKSDSAAGPWAALGTGLNPDSWQRRDFVRLIHRLLHAMRDESTSLGRATPVRTTPIRVGLLGYGAIGHEHASAVRGVDGLELAAVCDVSSERLAVAEAFSPGIDTLSDPQRFADLDIDLAIVSTPPNTHGDWARELVEAGRHVVLEKPMALTSEQCDAAIKAATAADRTLVVYQNRRYDPDFRAIMRSSANGDLGEIFHLEAFVGAYQHPCNYWHSDQTISGGALFDWGSHVVDQILQIMPGDVATVTAMNHKRVWHDVTNADHARMTMHFTDGREATFIYSDLAAALKPRWYVAGTKGGIIGEFRTERVISRSPIGTLDEDVLAAADSPPVLTLYSGDGQVTALPGEPAPRHSFHRELAEHLHHGMPMTVTAEQSRRVVAMLEAAEESARRQGEPVEPS